MPHSSSSANKKLFKSPFALALSAKIAKIAKVHTTGLHLAVPAAREAITGDLSSLETIPQPALSNAAVHSDVSVLETVPQEISPVVRSTRPLVYHTRPLEPPARPLEAPVLPVQSRNKKTNVVLVAILVCILAPSLLTLGYSANVYLLYSHARNGVNHLLKVKDIFTGANAHEAGLLDAAKLQAAQDEFAAAHDDFSQLHDMLKKDAVVNAVAAVLPQFGPQISSARSLSQIGVDVSDIGQKLVAAGVTVAPSFRGSLLTASKKPLVTPAMLALASTTIAYILPRLSDIQAQSRHLSLDVLPISAQQRDQLEQLLQAIPQAETDLTLAHDLMGSGWILGVDAPRTLLVQTMDRAELRPTGGFTGQFGELQIDAGRVAPFSLKNIGPYEENNPTSPVNGQLAPAPYSSWWTIPNWGLRDSNLSADFPTSARIAIQAYNYEFNRKVDGVMLFSPILIEHVLQITGPIQVPNYHETITAQNLEERLHYYQLDNAGIRKEQMVEHVLDATAARKLFTATVSRLMIDHLRHAPPDELIAIARELLYDLKTKDLQVYVTNAQIEDLLIKHSAAAQIDRSTTHDGLYIVQANVSASKASQYVRTVIHDTVSLDAKGGATHVMQLRLIYNQVGPVYGLDTYRDYIRIYVPPTSTYLWGDGFDTGVPFCSAGYGACPEYDAYSNGDLLCPAGQFDPGAATDMLGDPYLRRNHPLDQVGPPTSIDNSDEPGRNMYAGWAVIPKNCTLTISLSWYVPPMGHGPYTLLVQRQSSTFPELDLTILPTPGDCSLFKSQGEHVDSVMSSEDLTFVLKPRDNAVNNGGGCYPQMRT